MSGLVGYGSSDEEEEAAAVRSDHPSGVRLRPMLIDFGPPSDCIDSRFPPTLILSITRHLKRVVGRRTKLLFQKHH